LTTIVCNLEEMAGDLQFTNVVTGYKFKGKTKVYKFQPHDLHYPNGEFIVGFAGTASDIVTVAEFFSNPEGFRTPPKVRGLTGLVLTSKKEIFYFDTFTNWIRVGDKYSAIGSGAQVALGVLASGGSPTEAIKIASKHDAYTGMGMKTESFK
jgi:ATP-dependent protease HslVU (ClpYQ) peptidase subunit